MLKTPPLRHYRASFFTALLLASGIAHAAPHAVESYTVIQRECIETASGTALHASRSFFFDHHPRYLVTDIKSFETRLVDPAKLDCDSQAAALRVRTSRYAHALKVGTSAPHPLSNDGIQRARVPVRGTFLTADLCPAIHGKFEYRLFDELEKISTATSSPIPIGLAISGKWIKQHPSEFEEIIRMIETRKISVTWVNHSNTHPYRAKLKNSENFLLEKGVNPATEITEVEIALLQRGQIPSAFFRFPGLISNQEWMENLSSHSLIPLGSDAWIALDQTPRSGSIILIHANGNEAIGVTQFLEELPVIQKLGPFLPLSELF